MKSQRRCYKLFVILSLFFGLSTITQAKTDMNALFSKLSVPEKQIFLKKFPKGADIHFHLAGSATPEAMLRLRSNFCINQHTLSAEVSKACTFITTKDLSKHPQYYEEVVEAWSMKNFLPGKESAHDHFFNTFLKFQPIMSKKEAEILSLLREQASVQNISYLEPIISPDDSQVINFSHLIENEDDENKAIAKLLSNHDFIEHVEAANYRVKQMVANSGRILNCPGKAGCEVDTRFQYFILREQPYESIITQATAAFLAADKNPLIVGVNIVQAEDGIIALKDYKKHMYLLGLLHQRFPKVKLSLHAGELNDQIVSPEDISFHIHDAIFAGHADRIGHGTDIAFEDNALDTLKVMRERKIPVEINLSSNEIILGIKGKYHPLPLYLSQGVPVLLSTDDEGILRTTLSREYFLAVERYKLDYSTLKKISRNSLYYSFISGSSLWESDDYAKLKGGCSLEGKVSKSCRAFLKKNRKARLQFDLEKRFVSFEQSYA